jgi:hypothetical protein
MLAQDRYDSLIRFYCDHEAGSFRAYGRLRVPFVIVKRMILAESNYDPWASSPSSSAKGLMQLTDGTAREMGMLDSPFNPEENIIAGIKYLRQQFMKLWEIGDDRDRWRAAIFSYHSGRRWINRAMIAAYEEEHGERIPRSYMPGDERLKPGSWQTWTEIEKRIRLFVFDYRTPLKYVEDVLPNNISLEEGS